MKNTQKLILPGLFLVIILIVYFVYFAGKGNELGSFSDFDPNNTASKDIVVEYVTERGIQSDPAAGASIFYARDKNGQVYMIQGPLSLPDGFEQAETITLKGHIHKDSFHAHEVSVN